MYLRAYSWWGIQTCKQAVSVNVVSVVMLGGLCEKQLGLGMKGERAGQESFLDGVIGKLRPEGGRPR
jgi:hypothetical protein